MPLAGIRKAAKLAGQRNYFTGEPCEFGHIAPRQTANGVCRECHRIRGAQRYLLNPAAYIEAVKRYAVKCVEKIRRAKGYPTPTRPMPERCECCGGLPTGRGDDPVLNLDHDHKTGKFRGWLCTRCNLGIGLLDDSQKGLVFALMYIRRNT